MIHGQKNLISAQPYVILGLLHRKSLKFQPLNMLLCIKFLDPIYSLLLLFNPHDFLNATVPLEAQALILRLKTHRCAGISLVAFATSVSLK